MDGIFGNISLIDMDVIPVETNINPPKVQSSYVQIPGADGYIDYTEALGDVKYEAREIKIKCKAKEFSSFQSIYQALAKFIHGKQMTYKLTASDDHYFIGRWEISDVGYKNVPEIDIKGMVQPYRYKNEITVVSESIVESGVINCTNEMKSTMPVIETNADITIEFGDITASLNTGAHQVDGLILAAGDNEITVTGTADVSILYQEASL